MPLLLSPPTRPADLPRPAVSADKAASVPPAEPGGSSGFGHYFQAPHRLLGRSITLRQVVFGGLLAFCLTPWASPPIALALGLGLAQLLGNPFPAFTKSLTKNLLQFSVIGLGFGMNAQAAVQAGREGLLFTVVSIFGTLTLGYFIGKWLGLGRRVVHLISCGTAICGARPLRLSARCCGPKTKRCR
nr:putative sulfate exporter family transporter [Hymenobacter sp. BRD67]